MFAMRVEVALGEFDGFAYHDAHGDGGDGLGFCQFEGFADEVAVVDKGLVGQFGEAGAECLFAFGAGVDDDVVTTKGFGYLYFFADALDEGFRGERAYYSGGADDGNTARDAEAGIECLGGEFLAAGYGDTDVNAGYILMLPEQAFRFPCHHGTGSGIDGWFPHGYAQTGKRDGADSFAL